MLEETIEGFFPWNTCGLRSAGPEAPGPWTGRAQVFMLLVLEVQQFWGWNCWINQCHQSLRRKQLKKWWLEEQAVKWFVGGRRVTNMALQLKSLDLTGRLPSPCPSWLYSTFSYCKCRRFPFTSFGLLAWILPTSKGCQAVRVDKNRWE